MRNVIGSIGLAAILAAGAIGAARIANRRAYERGKDLCIASAGLSVAESERLNAEDGIAPGRPFSIEDYCGTQCRPGAIGWTACLDGCRDYCEADSGENPENR